MIFKETLNPEESSANIPQGFEPTPPIIVETKREGEKDRQAVRQTDRQTGSQSVSQREKGVCVCVIMTILINA